MICRTLPTQPQPLHCQNTSGSSSSAGACDVAAAPSSGGGVSNQRATDILVKHFGGFCYWVDTSSRFHDWLSVDEGIVREYCFFFQICVVAVPGSETAVFKHKLDSSIVLGQGNLLRSRKNQYLVGVEERCFTTFSHNHYHCTAKALLLLHPQQVHPRQQQQHLPQLVG